MGVIGPIAVLALLLGAVAISKFASADEAAPVLELKVSDDAPGMILVMLDVDVPPGTFQRVTWWVQGADGNPDSVLGRVVLDAPGRMGQGPVAITGLAAGDYVVEVDLVSKVDDAFQRRQGSEPISSSIEVVDAYAGESCGTYVEELENGGTRTVDISVCFALAAPGAELPPELDPAPFAEFRSQTTSTSAVTLDDGRIGLIDRSENLDWPVDTNDLAGGPDAWTRISVAVADRTATYAVTWWAAFGHEGATAETATEFLVPHGDSIDLGVIELQAGTAVKGEIMKLEGGEQVRLVEDETDIVNPCTQVLRMMPDGSTQYVNEVCGFMGRPALGPDRAGEWQVALRAGTYVFRFVDRPNYFGADNLLLYNVRFAPEWWRLDGDRAERLIGATPIPIPTDDADLDIQELVDENGAIDLGQRALRDARQLSVRVTGIPETLWGAIDPDGERQSFSRDELRASIRVVDDFGNWSGGAMDVGKEDGPDERPTPEPGVAEAAVTGLVEGRRYQILISFEGPNYSKWWLVGGGTLDDAAALEALDPLESPSPDGDPADDVQLIVEPWPAGPLLLTVHDENGDPYGAGEACVALIPVGHDARGAAACTDNRVGEGALVLQRVEHGRYRAVVFNSDWPNGPARPLGELVVGPDLDTFVAENEYSVGLSDLQGLADGASLPDDDFYDESRAVVLPDPGRVPPPPAPPDPEMPTELIVSIHDLHGVPFDDDQACLRLFADGFDESECTRTVDVPNTDLQLRGFVIIERPPLGSYAVEVSGPGVEGTEQLPDFDVTDQLEVLSGFGIGPSNAEEFRDVDLQSYDRRAAILVERGTGS